MLPDRWGSDVDHDIWLGNVGPDDEAHERTMQKILLDIETAPIDDAISFIHADEIAAPENYKDPIKIAAWIDREREKRVSKCALEPDLCRLVALGVMSETDEEPTIWTCRTEMDERLALSSFWRSTQEPGMQTTYVTFNGRRFDLPVLMRRSDYLGVRYQPVNLDRYRSPHVDLMDVLSFNGAITTRGQRFYARRFGLEIQDANVAGVDVPMLASVGTVEAWSQIVAHNRSDLLLLRDLARRLRVLHALTSAA